MLCGSVVISLVNMVQNEQGGIEKWEFHASAVEGTHKPVFSVQVIGKLYLNFPKVQQRVSSASGTAQISLGEEIQDLPLNH